MPGLPSFLQRRKTPFLAGFLMQSGRRLLHVASRLVRRGEPELDPEGWRRGNVERPWCLCPWDWRLRWEGLPSRAVRRARRRGREVARLTLGEHRWEELRGRGYLDVRSTHIPGLTYRLRVGRRVQLLWDTPEAARLIPWPARGYLCIQPAYPLPAVEFAAQLYLYLRDREAEVIRVAIPQAADAPIRRLF
jgi:hypothetical protein